MPNQKGPLSTKPTPSKSSQLSPKPPVKRACMPPTNIAIAAHRSSRETSKILGVDDIPTMEETTSIAMAIMDQALIESNSHRKETLLSIAKVTFLKSQHASNSITDELRTVTGHGGCPHQRQRRRARYAPSTTGRKGSADVARHDQTQCS